MDNSVSEKIIIRKEEDISNDLSLIISPFEDFHQEHSSPHKFKWLMGWGKKQSPAPIIYIISGVILFFLLVLIINSHVLHLKIDTAVVSVPMETMMAPVGGYISDVYVTEGMQVKKGTPLIKIENIDLERDLQLARIQAEDAKLNINYYQHLFTNEEQRLNIYKGIGSNRVQSAQAMLDISKQEVLNNQKNLNRMRILHTKHYISDANWDIELQKYKNAEEKMKNAMAQMNIENHSLDATQKGLYFTGTKLEGVEEDLQAQIAIAQKRLILNEEKVKMYEAILNKLILRAPFDGKVTQILKSAGNTTDNIKPLLLLEQTHIPKQIIAYLTQEEVVHISTAEKVKIYIPSLGQTFQGSVVEVNRTSGFVDEIKAQYRWRDFQIDRSAMVTININNINNNIYMFAGMPAIVYFPRKFNFF